MIRAITVSTDNIVHNLLESDMTSAAYGSDCDDGNRNG